MDDIVTITAGLPVDDPWVITNVNANVQNLATAKFASLGADQSVTIQKQNAALSDSVDCQSASNTFHLSASNTFHFFSPLMLAFALLESIRIIPCFQDVAVMRDAIQ